MSVQDATSRSQISLPSSPSQYGGVSAVLTKNLKFPDLDPNEEFTFWEIRAKSFFRAMWMWDVVSNPPDTLSEEEEEYDIVAYSLLVNCLPSKYSHIISGTKTANNLWKNIKKYIGTKTEADLNRAFLEAIETHMEAGQSIEDYIRIRERISADLMEARGLTPRWNTMSKEEQASYTHEKLFLVIYGIQKCPGNPYETQVSNLFYRLRKRECDMDDILEEIRQQEVAREAALREQSATVDQVEVQCFRCNGWGHMQEECPSPAQSSGRGRGGWRGRGWRGWRSRGRGRGRGGNSNVNGGNPNTNSATVETPPVTETPQTFPPTE